MCSHALFSAHYNDGVEIRIGNIDSVSDNPLCHQILASDFSHLAVKTMFCSSPLSGRYVSLQTTADSHNIAVCEVQVWTSEGSGELNIFVLSY